MTHRIASSLTRREALTGTWIMVFVPTVRELSTAVFLTGPQTRVMSLILLDFSEQGNLEMVAAASGLPPLVNLAVAMIGFRFIGRDFMSPVTIHPRRAAACLP